MDLGLWVNVEKTSLITLTNVYLTGRNIDHAERIGTCPLWSVCHSTSWPDSVDPQDKQTKIKAKSSAEKEFFHFSTYNF